MSDNKVKYLVQMVSCKDGSRSQPFEVKVEDFIEELAELCPEERLDDMVFVIASFVEGEEQEDWVWQSNPVVTVRGLIRASKEVTAEIKEKASV